MYSSAWTVSSQTYARTGCGLSNYYYEAIEVNVVESGCYTFGSNSNINTFDYIYKDTFDPFNPSRNLILHDDASLNDTQFKLITYLHVYTTYVLVVTTYYPNVTGEFWVRVLGPKNVSFNRIGEYLCYFLNNQNRITEYRNYL